MHFVGNLERVVGAACVYKSLTFVLDQNCFNVTIILSIIDVVTEL